VSASPTSATPLRATRGRPIRRIVDLAAFVVVLASAAVLGRHDALSATMLQPIDDEGYMKCCSSSDGKIHCCYWRGCEITANGCKAAS
jgi:hypothetical protein